MATPALDSDKREGLLDAIGTSSVEGYEVGTPEDTQELEASVAEPEATPEAEAAKAEPTPAAEPQEVAPTVDAGAQEHLDYLNSLMAEESAPAAPLVADQGRIAHLEQQLTTLQAALGSRLEEASQRIAASPEAVTPTGEATTDLSKVDWTKPELLDRIQEITGGDRETAVRFAQAQKEIAAIQGEALGAQATELHALRDKVSQIETSTQTRDRSGQIQKNLVSGVQNSLELDDPAVSAVANQFVTKLDESLKKNGQTQEAWVEGLNASVLGRRLLENTTASYSPTHSAKGVYDTILTVAMETSLSRRKGTSAETVLTGSKEEVGAALTRAHGVAPSESSTEELSPEDAIKKEIMDAAIADRQRFESNPIFGGKPKQS